MTTLQEDLTSYDIVLYNHHFWTFFYSGMKMTLATPVRRSTFATQGVTRLHAPDHPLKYGTLVFQTVTRVNNYYCDDV